MVVVGVEFIKPLLLYLVYDSKFTIVNTNLNIKSEKR